MPWATARQVRQEVASEVGRLKQELVDDLKKFVENLLTEKDLKTEVEDIQATVSNLSTQLSRQNKKLAALIESTVRGAIVGKYGQEWTEAKKIDSVRGVVEYVRAMTGEQAHWATRTESDIIDVLLSQEMVRAVVGGFQAQFAASTAENWAIARERVIEKPLVNQDGEPIVGNIIRLIGAGPMYFKDIFLELRQILLKFDRESFATSGISLVALMMLSDPGYLEGGEIPPHMLEFDCGGTVVENMPGKIHMTGGEIKSSAAGENQLFRRFRLLETTLKITHPSWVGHEFLGEDYVFAPWFGPADPVLSYHTATMSESFRIGVTREELQRMHGEGSQ